MNRAVHRSIAGTMLVLVLLLASPGSATASDEVLARESATHMWALDGTVVYDGGFGWARIVHRHVLLARRLPDEIARAGIGRDRSGRVVLTFSTERRARDGTLLSRHWWIYDVMADRKRRVHGVIEPGCLATALAIWRSRAAYSCVGESAVFLRTGRHIREISVGVNDFAVQQDLLVLRGATLVGILDEGDGDSSVGLLADATGVCSMRIPGSFGTGDYVHPTGLWLSGGYAIWSTADTFDGEPVYSAVQTVRLRPGCASGQAKPLPFSPRKRRVEAMAVDAGFIYYAGQRKIYRHRLPARFSGA